MRGLPACSHVLQLFDSDESRADAVATYIAEGCLQGETVIAVVTPRHWEVIAARLESLLPSMEEAQQSGSLRVLNAFDTLNLFMRDWALDVAEFHRSVGTLVNRLLTSERRVRAYGEMVDVLLSRGDFRNAEQLEVLWNDIAWPDRMTLFCGYSSVNFGDPATAAHLRGMCGLHARVRTDTHDILASFLLAEYDALSGGRFPTA